jgi:PKD repeat protein
MKKLFSTLLLILIADFVSAQGDFCLTDKIWMEMIKKDSSLYFNRKLEDDAISKVTNNIHSNKPDGQIRTESINDPLIIPTVIYIIHDGSPASNIDMVQIQSQMDQLNQNFYSAGIQFCYAKRNTVDTAHFIPQPGDSAGVFRINSPLTNVDQQTQDAQLKALSTLPSQNYMRIFVVKDITPAGVLGYAYYPGTSTALDGIVIRADVFGSNNFCSACNLYPGYNLGAAMTHEVGHYLNLYHTFQGGCISATGVTACHIYGDRICDTPPTTGSYGCPSPAPLSCDGITPELIENYMDYTEDPCKISFTSGQIARMNYCLYSYRPSLFAVRNLIATGVTCVDLGNQYADFYCANYNGCLNRPMTFSSLSSPGFIYTWDFGDGSSASGVTVQHTFIANGQFPVTLTAVNTSQNINVSSTTPVFITDCQPINCSLNKWDFTFGFMDFSSGTPIATNHPTMSPMYPIPDFYASFYRADSLGNALFHIAYRSIHHSWGGLPVLYDSSYNLIDSIPTNIMYTLYPVPNRINNFCLVAGSSFDSTAASNALDTLTYSIIEAQNGNVVILPGKKRILVPFQPYINVTPGRTYANCGIPGCDGTKVWIIVYAGNSNNYYVFELDSSGTLSLHQTYTAGPSYGIVKMAPSPDGRKIALFDYGLNSIILNFDKANGIITGYDTISSAVWAGLGVFSPNSRFYYQPEKSLVAGSTSKLYQYDLYSPQPIATRKLIDGYIVNNPSIGSQGHSGPDGKLYFGFFANPANAPETYRLAVINHPDVLEDGLNSVGFNMNGPDIKPANCPYPGINIFGFLFFDDFCDAFGCNWKPDVPSPFTYESIDCNTYSFHSDDCFSNNWNFGDVNSGVNNTSILSNPQHTFTTAGNFVVSRTINGVTISDSIRIETPDLQVSETKNCNDLFYNYSIALSQPVVNYSWTITNGLPAHVSSATNIDVLWNDTSSISMLKVVAVNQNTGCSDSLILIPDFDCLQLSTLDQEFGADDILIQPNPFKESFLLSSSLRYNGNLELQLLNLIGETIQEKSYYLNNERLHIFFDTKFLSSGVYMLRLKTKNGIVLKKVVME